MCKVSSSYSTINKQNNKPKVNVGRKIHLHLPRVNLYQKQNPWHFNFPKLSLLLKKIFLEHLTLDESLHFGLRSSGGLFTCSYVKNEGFHFSAARANTWRNIQLFLTNTSWFLPMLISFSRAKAPLFQTLSQKHDFNRVYNFKPKINWSGAARLLKSY